MTTTIHHVSCCTSRVCLGVCLGVLVCTTHFHNCICCGKRGTYSHFRLWFINPSDSSQCTHSFISPLTFFFRAKERLPSLFFCLWKALPRLRLWRKVHMILTFMAAHSRIITFSRKCSCTSFNVWFVRFLRERMMVAERKNTQQEYLFSFFSWITKKCPWVKGSYKSKCQLNALTFALKTSRFLLLLCAES